MTTTNKATKPELFLQLLETRDGEYFHLRARVVTRKFENSQWMPWGVDDDYSDGLLYSGLRVNCQGDATSRRGDRSGPVYGFDVDYQDVYSVDRRKARRMLKTLDMVHKKLDKLSDARGYVRSYGEYLGRVAEAFGCSGMVMEREKHSQSVTGERYRWFSIGDGVNHAAQRIYQWQEEGAQQQQTA